MVTRSGGFRWGLGWDSSWGTGWIQSGVQAGGPVWDAQLFAFLLSLLKFSVSMSPVWLSEDITINVLLNPVVLVTYWHPVLFSTLCGYIFCSFPFQFTSISEMWGRKKWHISLHYLHLQPIQRFRSDTPLVFTAPLARCGTMVRNGGYISNSGELSKMIGCHLCHLSFMAFSSLQGIRQT